MLFFVFFSPGPPKTRAVNGWKETYGTQQFRQQLVPCSSRNLQRVDEHIIVWDCDGVPHPQKRTGRCFAWRFSTV